MYTGIAGHCNCAIALHMHAAGIYIAIALLQLPRSMQCIRVQCSCDCWRTACCGSMYTGIAGHCNCAIALRMHACCRHIHSHCTPAATSVSVNRQRTVHTLNTCILLAHFKRSPGHLKLGHMHQHQGPISSLQPRQGHQWISRC